MFVLHSRPANISWSLVGTGASFLTSASRLTDGVTSRTCRIDWLSTSSPATSDYVALQGVWTTATVLRGTGMFYLVNIPEGVKVEIRGKRPADGGYTYALGGNALTQLTTTGPDGRIRVCWLFDDGLDAVTAFEIRIYNDLGGATFLDAADYIEIGEVFPGQGEEWCVRSDLGDTLDDPTLFMESVGNQQFAVERKRAQIYRPEIIPTAWSGAYGESASLKALREKLVGGVDVMLYPVTRTPGQGSAAATEYDVLNLHAIVGKCRNPGQLQAVSGQNYWSLTPEFRESPAP